MKESLLVVVLNHHFDKRSLAEDPSVFHPVDVTTEITIPAWLRPVDVFRVAHDGLTDIDPERLTDGTLQIRNTVSVNDLIVITGREGMKAEIAAKLAKMQEKLQRAYTAEAVHTTDPSPYAEGEIF